MSRSKLSLILSFVCLILISSHVTLLTVFDIEVFFVTEF